MKLDRDALAKILPELVSNMNPLGDSRFLREIVRSAASRRDRVMLPLLNEVNRVSLEYPVAESGSIPKATHTVEYRTVRMVRLFD